MSFQSYVKRANSRSILHNLSSLNPSLFLVSNITNYIYMYHPYACTVINHPEVTNSRIQRFFFIIRSHSVPLLNLD